MEISEECQVKKIAYKLKRGASAWWDIIQSIRRRHGELAVALWELMKRLMYEQFLPSDYQRTLFKRYHYHCPYGNVIVAEYANEFQELRVRNDLNENKLQENLRFITGLRVLLLSLVDMRHVMRFPKNITLVSRYEFQLDRSFKSFF